MNLYLLTRSAQSHEANPWYDTFDSAVVAAETEEEACTTHPRGILEWDGKPTADWPVVLDGVSAKLVGVAAAGVAAGVICASFNAA